MYTFNKQTNEPNKNNIIVGIIQSIQEKQTP